MKIDVKGNDVVRAYKKMKRKLTQDGVFDVMKDKRYFVKQSEKRRKARQLQKFNARKQQWDSMISTGAADRWMKKDKRYKEAIDELQNVTLDHVELKLHELIDDLNVPAILFYMKTKGKARGYIERSELAVEGSVESKLIEWTPANKQ